MLEEGSLYFPSVKTKGEVFKGDPTPYVKGHPLLSVIPLLILLLQVKFTALFELNTWTNIHFQEDPNTPSHSSPLSSAQQPVTSWMKANWLVTCPPNGECAVMRNITILYVQVQWGLLSKFRLSCQNKYQVELSFWRFDLYFTFTWLFMSCAWHFTWHCNWQNLNPFKNIESGTCADIIPDKIFKGDPTEEQPSRYINGIILFPKQIIQGNR